MLRAKLVVVGGDAKQTEVELRLPTIIGRGHEANLTVPHKLVSRRHTEIIEQDGQLLVRDLGSLNGTYIDNERIESDSVLAPNQLLTLGTVTFRAVYEIASELEDETTSQTESVKFEEINDSKIGSPFLETIPVDSLSQRLAMKTNLENLDPDSDPDIQNRDTVRDSEELENQNHQEVPFASSLSSLAGLNEAANGSDSEELQRESNELQTPAGALNFAGTPDQASKNVDSFELDLVDNNAPQAADSVKIENVEVSLHAKAAGMNQPVDGVPDESVISNLNDTELGSFLKKLPK